MEIVVDLIFTINKHTIYIYIYIKIFLNIFCVFYVVNVLGFMFHFILFFWVLHLGWHLHQQVLSMTVVTMFFLAYCNQKKNYVNKSENQKLRFYTTLKGFEHISSITGKNLGKNDYQVFINIIRRAMLVKESICIYHGFQFAWQPLKILVSFTTIATLQNNFEIKY